MQLLGHAFTISFVFILRIKQALISVLTELALGCIKQGTDFMSTCLICSMNLTKLGSTIEQ